MPEVTHPIDGQVILLAGAKASVPLERLSELLEQVQRHLAPRRSEYERRYECVSEADGWRAFLVEPQHWKDVGAELDLNERETDAVARTHAEQVRRLGKDTGREAEFETALEIREAVVLAYS